MSEPGHGRVAVYIDFDNIVISRYDQVHGRGQFMRDRQKSAGDRPKPAFAAKLEEARVDLGAIIDFASSFGTLVLTRAYADWSAAVNAEYCGQLVGRAVDLVQLFPAAAYAKNGADIRLAVDAVEDLFRLPELTHVVVVAGDSDYVPLAQRIKRLGRYVIGIGVAGSTAKSLAAACDEFDSYDDIPGIAHDDGDAPDGDAHDDDDGDDVDDVEAVQATSRSVATTTASTAKTARTAGTPRTASAEEAAGGADTMAENAPPTRSRGSRRARVAAPAADATSASEASDTEDAVDSAALADAEQSDDDLQTEATRLLTRALQLGHEKDDAEWLHSSSVKGQMKRMDPSFSEKALGYRSFSDFVKSRSPQVELDDSSTAQMLRLARTRSRRARHSGRATDAVSS